MKPMACAPMAATAKTSRRMFRLSAFGSNDIPRIGRSGPVISKSLFVRRRPTPPAPRRAILHRRSGQAAYSGGGTSVEFCSLTDARFTSVGPALGDIGASGRPGVHRRSFRAGRSMSHQLAKASGRVQSMLAAKNSRYRICVDVDPVRVVVLRADPSPREVEGDPEHWISEQRCE